MLIEMDITESMEELKKSFNNTSDLILYKFKTSSNHKCLIAYLSGMVDRKSLNEDLIKPMIKDFDLDVSIRTIVFIAGIKEAIDYKDIEESIINGHIVLFIDGLESIYSFDLSQWEKRAVEESDTEQVINGSNEGFVEDIEVNKVLIRRRIRNSNLVFENLIIGVQTNTKVSIVFLDGIVDEEILDELRNRINNIKTDAILESGYIKQFIEESPFSVLSTIGTTQKPDVAVGKLLEGRIVVLCDGTPSSLTLPRLFIEELQTAEDYYLRPIYASFLRMIRVIALFISILAPGLYIALQTFQPEMIPTKLLISMAGARINLPLSASLEAFVMVILFEIIKESGLRLPKALGSAVSVVGSLVIGQSAVEAGIIGTPMVLIVAMTGIAELVLPSLKEMLIVYRILFIILGSLAGLYGITCGIIVTVAHAISLKSFGVPYLYPVAPYDKEGMKDFIIRFPYKKMYYRPRAIANRKVSRKRNEIK